MTAKLRARLTSCILYNLDCFMGIISLASLLKECYSRADSHNCLSTFQSGLINGGPAVLIYGAFLSWLGALAVCASLAEMASM